MESLISQQGGALPFLAARLPAFYKYRPVVLAVLLNGDAGNHNGVVLEWRSLEADRGPLAVTHDGVGTLASCLVTQLLPGHLFRYFLLSGCFLVRNTPKRLGYLTPT
jgi:hypothetical protein